MKYSCLPNSPKSLKPKFFAHLNLNTQSQLQSTQIHLHSPSISQTSPLNISYYSDIILSLHWKELSLKSKKFKPLDRENNEFQQEDGYQQLQYQNKSIFKGIVQDGIRIKGVILYPSGISMKCQFQDDQLHGKSQIHLKSGTIVQIQWQNGLPLSQGIIRYDNGDLYKGDIHNFKKHGIGELKFAQKGSYYIGQFKNGRISGKGTLFQNGRMKAVGQWKDGALI